MQDVSQQDRVLKQALACRTDLIAYAWSLLGDYSAAEDAVQEAMLVVVHKYDQFQEGTSMLAWCRSIVRFEVLRARQSARRQQALVDRILEDAIDAAFDEFQSTRRRDEAQPWHDALRYCINKIGPRSRGVLDARFVDELSYEQIGKRLGMTLEAVRKALFRIKKQVRACVESNLKGAL